MVTSTPDYTLTPSVLPTESITPTPNPSETPVVIIIIVTATPSDTPTPTETPIEMPTEIPSQTPTFTPTDTPIIIYVTATPTDTPTPTATFTITETPTVTLTPTNSPEPSETLIPTESLTPTETIIPTDSVTPTQIPTDEPTVTISPYNVPIDSPTSTPTNTPTEEPTTTVPEMLVTATETPIPSETPTTEPTVSPTPPSNSAIGGAVFNDTNQNGIYDRGDFGEVGQEGWVVKVYNEDWSRAVTVITNQTGTYFVVGLHGGLYHVCEVLPNGWVQTIPVSESSNTVADLPPELGNSICHTIIVSGNRLPTYTANFGNTLIVPTFTPTFTLTPTETVTPSNTPVPIEIVSQTPTFTPTVSPIPSQAPVLQQLVVTSSCSDNGNSLWTFTNTNSFSVDFYYNISINDVFWTQTYYSSVSGASQTSVYTSGEFTKLYLYVQLGPYTLSSQHVTPLGASCVRPTPIITPTPDSPLTSPTEAPTVPTATISPTPNPSQSTGSSHISGQLFIDENQSGSLETEEGEELLSDEATIFLYDSSWSQVATQTAIGGYSFQSLSGGLYYICSSELLGWNITTPVFEDANSILNPITANNSDFCHSTAVDGQVGSQNLNFGFF